MRVNREKFLQSLEAVAPGLASKEIVEQSTCFIFRKGRVYSFNDELACHIPSPIDPEFSGAVPAAKLLENLKKWSEDEIEIEPKEGELVFIGKRRRAGLRLEKDITLPIDVVEKPKEWTQLPEDFGDAVKLVQQCAGKDESKFHLTCVHIHPKWVEASDNCQVCRWRLRTGIKDPTLVRQTSIKHICSLGMVEFSETPSWIHFRNNSQLVLSCRRYVETFPDPSKYLEIEGEPATLPKGLVEAAEAAKDFSSENVDDDQILVELLPGKVTVRGEGVSGWYEESRNLKNYAGQNMSFMIPPQLLSDIVTRHSECRLSPEKLIVTSGKYVYMTCLSEPQSRNGHVESNGKMKKVSGDEVKAMKSKKKTSDEEE